jgi:hemolysin activation/secretion protein
MTEQLSWNRAMNLGCKSVQKQLCRALRITMSLRRRSRYWSPAGTISFAGGILLALPSSAQTPPNIPPQEVTPPRQEEFEALPETPSEDDLPRLYDLLPEGSDDTPGTIPPDFARLRFTRFELQGSNAFDDAALTAAIQAEVTLPSDRPATYAELVQIAAATEAYYLRNDRLFEGFDLTLRADGTLVLMVREWTIADIEVTGLQRLRPGYVSSRLALAAGTPVDIRRLEDALQLLDSDPLIASFEADLGLRGDAAVLQLEVTEAETFSADLTSNNGRSPSIGPFQRGIQFREGNLLGLGDSVSLNYNGTDGSNSLSAGYTVPVSPYNTTVSFSYSTSDSRIIQPPFDIFDIRSTARYYDLTLRHPLIQTPREELALGLTFSRWETESRFLENLIGQSVPLETLGSDDQGRTRLSVLRFSQEWTQRGQERDRVLALRSQFNLGLDAFDATINDQSPDGRFLSWRGQGQYVQLLAPDTLLLLRGTVQLSDRPLVPLEQFALGGAGTVRGYRRDAVTADNGVFFSAEARFPILWVPELGDGLLQIAPFVDVGRVWSSGELQPALGTLAAIGLGLRWQSEGISAQLDWGLPLTATQVGTSNLRDSSLQFSLTISPF